MAKNCPLFHPWQDGPLTPWQKAARKIIRCQEEIRYHAGEALEAIYMDSEKYNYHDRKIKRLEKSCPA